MAEISKKGNSFFVRVKVWESRGQLRIVGGDPAFKGTAGIHIPVKTPSQSEESLRKIGAELGVQWPSDGLVEDHDRLTALPSDELQEAVTNLPDEQMRQVAAWVQAWRDENLQG